MPFKSSSPPINFLYTVYGPCSQPTGAPSPGCNAWLGLSNCIVVLWWGPMMCRVCSQRIYIPKKMSCDKAAQYRLLFALGTLHRAFSAGLERLPGAWNQTAPAPSNWFNRPWWSRIIFQTFTSCTLGGQRLHPSAQWEDQNMCMYYPHISSWSQDSCAHNSSESLPLRCDFSIMQ